MTRDGSQRHRKKKTNFFSENGGVYEIMWKKVVRPDRALVSIWRMRMACWIPKSTDRHTLTLCNTYCFSTAKMVARTRHNVTLYVHCLSCFSTVNPDLNC